MKQNAGEHHRQCGPSRPWFDVLADPSTHQAIDGTGWVRESLDGKRLTETGQIFRMAMYHENHPDKDYEMANRVEVFDPPRAIAWQPSARAPDESPRSRVRRVDLALRPQAGR